VPRPDAAGERLEAGLLDMGIQVSTPQRSALLEYLSLLVRWNKSFNLTAVRDPLAMVDRHLLDSLAILPFVGGPGRRLIDVGTGAGLPGVPLAIMQLANHVDLLDSNGKKTRFLFQVKTALGLANMAVRHARVESWVPGETYDIVVSRAFASLPDMVSCCAHLCDSDTRLLAMKGQEPSDELADLGPEVHVLDIHSLRVPGLDEDRHLVEMQLDQSSRDGTQR
jgi:16S rRNA (guanine527-N7)-methyltransferase